MDIINLGATDGPPPVDWADIVEKLDDCIAAGARRPQRSYDVAHDRQRGREPARDRGRCAVVGRKLLVPDGIENSKEPQCRARPALFGRGVNPRCRRRRRR